MNQKINPLEDLVSKIQKYKKQGMKIVFTNGCFDLIHPGHTRYLQAAREAGDILVVGVNSDASIQKIKDPRRPILPLLERVEILSGFYFIDYIVAFDEETPLKLIEAIIPDILVKGGDWPVEKIVGKNFVEQHGGKVFTIPEIPGASTTSIVETILKRYQT